MTDGRPQSPKLCTDLALDAARLSAATAGRSGGSGECNVSFGSSSAVAAAVVTGAHAEISDCAMSAACPTQGLQYTSRKVYIRLICSAVPLSWSPRLHVERPAFTGAV